MRNVFVSVNTYAIDDNKDVFIDEFVIENPSYILDEHGNRIYDYVLNEDQEKALLAHVNVNQPVSSDKEAQILLGILNSVVYQSRRHSYYRSSLYGAAYPYQYIGQTNQINCYGYALYLSASLYPGSLAGYTSPSWVSESVILQRVIADMQAIGLTARQI